VAEGDVSVADALGANGDAPSRYCRTRYAPRPQVVASTHNNSKTSRMMSQVLRVMLGFVYRTLSMVISA